MRWAQADRMGRLPQQFFAGLVARVNERIRAGYDVINLGQGNPDQPTPPHIVEALRAAALNPVNHRYPPFTGLRALKEAVSEFYRKEYDVDIDPESEVAVLFGGKTGLVELSEIYLDPGDIAVVPDPGYPDYWSGVALAGGTLRTVPLLEENQFLPDFSTLTPREWDCAKMLFLNYPNNPTAATADEKFYQDVVNLADRHNVLVIHDFAYGAIGFDGYKPRSFLQTEGAKAVGIEIYTMSKTYNMAGWRLAFVVGNREVVSAVNLLQDHYYVSIFPAVQHAGIAALTGPQDCVHDLVSVYQSRRDAFVGEMGRSGYEIPAPRGSFFAWMPIPNGLTAVDFANRCLEQANVVVAPGTGFGVHGEGYVRIGLLTHEDRLREAARRLTAAL